MAICRCNQQSTPNPRIHLLPEVTHKKTQKHTHVVLVVLVLLGLLVFTTASENGNTALIAGQNCKRRKQKMSKERKVILIFDIICAIIAAVLVIVNVCKGRFGAAILWNMNFSLWLYNTAESLRFGEMEKIIVELEEEDNEK